VSRCPDARARRDGFASASIGVVVYRPLKFWLPIVSELPSLIVIPAIGELRTRFQRAER